MRARSSSRAGQQQRVAIARALAMEAGGHAVRRDHLALDPELVGEVLRVVESLRRRNDAADVTHENELRTQGVGPASLSCTPTIHEWARPGLFGAPQTAELKQFLSALADSSSVPLRRRRSIIWRTASHCGCARKRGVRTALPCTARAPGRRAAAGFARFDTGPCWIGPAGSGRAAADIARRVGTRRAPLSGRSCRPIEHPLLGQRLQSAVGRGAAGRDVLGAQRPGRRADAAALIAPRPLGSTALAGASGRRKRIRRLHDGAGARRATGVSGHRRRRQPAQQPGHDGRRRRATVTTFGSDAAAVGGASPGGVALRVGEHVAAAGTEQHEHADVATRKPRWRAGQAARPRRSWCQPWGAVPAQASAGNWAEGGSMRLRGRLGATRRAGEHHCRATFGLGAACAAPPSCGSARGAARPGRVDAGQAAIHRGVATSVRSRWLGRRPASSARSCRFRPRRHRRRAAAVRRTVTRPGAAAAPAGGRRTPRAARRCSVAVRRGGSRVPSRCARKCSDSAGKLSWISSGTVVLHRTRRGRRRRRPAAGRTHRAERIQVGPTAWRSCTTRRTLRSERSWLQDAG